MSKEEFVSFETAKLLKEKGFNCFNSSSSRRCLRVMAVR